MTAVALLTVAKDTKNNIGATCAKYTYYRCGFFPGNIG
ncbi:hypothetical protein JCM19238_2125 [Vibrio ponticus]|nr:hypothetical protein JCM19238_2125 [Vibrio ponticus]